MPATKTKPAAPPTAPAPIETTRKLISVADVLRLTQWSPMTLERRLVAGEFPNPVEGGHGFKRKWTLAQYEKWAKQLEDKAARAV